MAQKKDADNGVLAITWCDVKGTGTGQITTEFHQAVILGIQRNSPSNTSRHTAFSMEREEGGREGGTGRNGERERERRERERES